MAKYKCKNLGECDRANSGEVFEIAAGDDMKCPSCGTGSMLEVVKTPTGGGSEGSKLPLIAGAAVAVALLAGGGYYFTAGRSRAPAAIPPTESAPAPVRAIEPPPAATAATASGMAPTEAETKALRKDSENKLAAGDAVNAEQASNKAAANEMLKLAIAKMAQGKLDEAAADLLAARERDPKQSLVPYNLAVLRLKQGRKEEALKEFEASFMAGFSYFDKMDQDPDLEVMRKDARFNELVAQYRNKPTTK